MHLIFNENKLFLICYGYSQGLELRLNAASVAVNCDRQLSAEIVVGLDVQVIVLCIVVFI